MNFSEGSWGESPEGGKQEVLHVEAGDLLLIVVESADAGVILAESGERLGDGMDVAEEGHTPPQVSIFGERNGAIAADQVCGFNAERNAGVAEGEESAALYGPSECVRRAMRGAETADGMAVCKVAGAGADHSRIGVGEEFVAEDFDAPWVGDVVCVLADEPGCLALVEEVIECGDEALGGSLDDSERKLMDGVEVGAALGVWAVKDDEDLKVGAGLGDEALDGGAEPWHSGANRYADGKEATVKCRVSETACVHAAGPCRG